LANIIPVESFSKVTREAVMGPKVTEMEKDAEMKAAAGIPEEVQQPAQAQGSQSSNAQVSSGEQNQTPQA
jgi:hypothetical protein